MNQLGVFLKAPVAGAVKTRLGQALGMEEAAAVYRAFCGDLAETLASLESTNLWVFYSPATALESCQTLFAGAAPEAVEWRWRPQSDGDLGDRMRVALEELLGHGGPAALVGTDLPTLTCEACAAAFRALERVPVVFGPAKDGGYYLIGLTRMVSGLFTDIAWSTSAVLDQSLAQLRRDGCASELLACERDVDTLEDLRVLSRQLKEARGGIAPRTRRACEELGV